MFRSMLLWNFLFWLSFGFLESSDSLALAWEDIFSDTNARLIQENADVNASNSDVTQRWEETIFGKHWRIVDVLLE